jgi:alkylation response protein AidB-like acyl-CoA dehydrogenase
MLGRKQFNQKLSDMQYLQFKFADMATDLVASRYLNNNIKTFGSKSCSNGIK